MNVQWTNDRVLKLIELYHGKKVYGTGNKPIIKIGIKRQMRGTASWKSTQRLFLSSKNFHIHILILSFDFFSAKYIVL
jgi:hypothetical protein